MTLFLDTSSLLKIYHREKETDEILRLISDETGKIYLSELAKTEFNSAVYKKVRSNEFTLDKATEIIGYFEDDYDNYSWIAVDIEIIISSKELIKKYGILGLRTLDSIQLACAVSKQTEIGKYKTSDLILQKIFVLENLEIC